MQEDLFMDESGTKTPIVEGMYLLRTFCQAQRLAPVIDEVLNEAPLRHMETARGFRMSVSMSNCGEYGWLSDRAGYRYSRINPETGRIWPRMPEELRTLASTAASTCGYLNFKPDACLINCYEPGARMGAHQDKNERDFSQPVVSVSLGLPARFFIRGSTRGGRSVSVDLDSGDVLVWGGVSRLYYHGIRPLKNGIDELFGARRFNLTFRHSS